MDYNHRFNRRQTIHSPVFTFTFSVLVLTTGCRVATDVEEDQVVAEDEHKSNII